MHKIVLDTNIVISAAISIDGSPAKIFELLLEDKIKNYTSKEIIEELEEVIKRPFFKEHIDKEFKDFILKNFKNKSVLIKPMFKENIVSDKKDNKFINCALTAKADIISGDKHLLELKKYRYVKIYGAKEFLKNF